MKFTTTTFISAIILVLFFAVPSLAQKTSNVQSQDLESFDQIRVIADAEVIVTKSNRNHIKLIGDSTYIRTLPFSIKDQKLMFVYEEDGQKKIEKVVIEYKDINRIVTGGNGNFLIKGLDEQKLDIHNLSAKLTLKGQTENARIYSQKGNNNILDLEAQKIVAYIGDEAVLTSQESY